MMMVLVVVTKILLAVAALWWTLGTVGNIVQGNAVPWWFSLTNAVLVVAWAYVEYFV